MGSTWNGRTGLCVERGRHNGPFAGSRYASVPSRPRLRSHLVPKSLLFLGLLAAICLGLNLAFLAAYLVCACCCRPDPVVQTKQRSSCCVTWTAVVAGLVCCAAVGAGFYGNSETHDGAHQLIYSLENANHTFSGIDELVSENAQKLQVDLEQHLARLNELFAARGDYIQTLKFMQQMAGSIVQGKRGRNLGTAYNPQRHAPATHLQPRPAACPPGQKSFHIINWLN
ncbi:protein tweety homolog 2-like [Marmota marmota marmota]|uniref:protein tweety homolog 2-like n=1 Tax=Marmota marmota marmota TaxID=9994 RepID=UPI0020933397|nr:protein tweety homolog 2-like [Marmota marmota marmota]